MKYIKKNPEPRSLRRWIDEQSAGKYDVSYQNGLRNAPVPYEDVKKGLVKEQGYLCCYTGKRIDEKNSHIEHLKPQELSRLNGDNDDVKYENMLAAYPGNKNEKGKPACAFGAVVKDNNILPVTPLQENCERRFLFNLKGEISAAVEDDKDAEATIEILRLNDPQLTEDRFNAIDELLFQDKVRQKTAERYAETIEETNGKGRYRQFCYVLKQACILYAKRKEKQRQRDKFAEQSRNRR